MKAPRLASSLPPFKHLPRASAAEVVLLSLELGEEGHWLAPLDSHCCIVAANEYHFYFSRDSIIINHCHPLLSLLHLFLADS
jgi:hypothetical protein